MSVDSPKLNETFNNQPVLDSDSKMEYLLYLWIDPKFAKRLNTMFAEIKASSAEILWVEKDIVSSNIKINEQQNLSKFTKTHLATMKASNDYN